jgi:hypothetical protein
MKMRLFFAAVSTATIFATSATTALALPLGSNFGVTTPPGVVAPQASAIHSLGLADITDPDFDVDFTAIIALSNCSGSLVRFVNSAATDMAMVLTNGHCLEGGFINAGDAVVNRPSTRTLRLLSSDASRTVATLRATKVLYATMTGTDMTLYRLNTTYADIQVSYGVAALTISDHRPDVGAPIRIVSGYWKRIYACNLDNFVYELREDQWTFRDSIRYSRPGCETIGGTSGSPIIHADSKEVIGINNTGNENGARCTMNNPCEVNELGEVTVTRGASYGQELYWLYDCLTVTNEVDLDLPSCELTKPRASSQTH